jgi:hypothetical protein
VGKFSLYNIPLRSLTEGKHEFKYDLDNKYFALIDDGTADIKRGNLKVVVSLKRPVLFLSSILILPDLF